MTVRSPEPAESVSPSERIVYTVAEQTNTEPHELPPLYDSIDPDSIDRLLTSMEHGELQFQYAGQAVTVNSDGSVDVSEPVVTHPVD